MGCYRLYNEERNKGKPIEKFSEFREAYDFFHDLQKDRQHTYIFRGENYHKDCGNNVDEALKSSLDKAFERFDVGGNDRGDIEADLYRSFRRRAQLYCGDKSMDMLEALALLRHYEGPARMLDWTYSLFVALFWAVSKSKCGENLVVWALNNNWLAERDKDFEEGKVDKAAEPCDKSSKGLECLMKCPRPFIYAVNPFYLNERLSIQQGVLLVQGDIAKSWGANLREMLEDGGNTNYVPLLWRIDIELGIDHLKDVLGRLRDMNINLATLYPDIGGFSQSLNTYRKFLDPA